MKIVALLTGRGNNTFKDKNVREVIGKPLLQYTCMAARSCSYIDDFYVSSDDEKILNAASKLGYKKIKRPAELSTAKSQHIDTIIHALKVMADNGCKPDILVVQMANSAIIETRWIEESIRAIIDNTEISAVVPVEKDMDHHPYRCKRLRDDGFLDTWFDFNGKNISTNRQDLPANYALCHNFWTLNLHKSIYSDKPGQQPWTFMGNNIWPIEVQESFDVHDEDDLKRTEKWLLEHEDSLGYPLYKIDMYKDQMV